MRVLSMYDERVVEGAIGASLAGKGVSNMRAISLSLVLVCLVVSGCDPEQAPRFSPDGKKIALLVPSGHLESEEADEKPKDVAVLTVASGELVVYPLPDQWDADGIKWWGEKLIIWGSRLIKTPDASTPKGKKYDLTYWLLTPEAEEGEGRYVDMHIMPHIALAPFTGRFAGRACIYVQDMDSQTTKTFALDGAAESGTLPYEVEGAGDGWMIREVMAEATRPLIEGEHTQWILDSLPEDKRTRTREELVGVDVFNPDATRVIRISREEIGKASYREPRGPICARISDDHRRLLLGFDTSTIFRQHPFEYTFGVYDIKTGKLLWHGSSNALRGLPVFVGDSIYALEAKSQEIYTGERTVAALVAPVPPRGEPTSEIVFARHTQDGRKVILQLPLKKTEKATLYSASEDRSKFVLYVESKHPRLLIVPIGDSVALEDIISLPINVPREKPDTQPSSGTRLSPKDMMVAFFEAVRQNKPEEANRLIAVFPNVPADKAARRIAEMVAMASARQWDCEAISGKAIDDVAVVVINECFKDGQKSFDLGPAYLILQERSWRVLPDLMHYDRRHFEFSADRISKLRQLEKWFNKQRDELWKKYKTKGR